MATAVAERGTERVKPSKRQSRRKRRLRFAKQAADVAREEKVQGRGPTIATSGDFHMACACGFDPNAREMRRREPPTRSSNGNTGTRLNKRNGWYQEGDAKVLVSPVDGAAWLWWLSLPDDDQDQVYELSAKCSAPTVALCHEDADPVGMLVDPKGGNAKIAQHGEDPRSTWGRLER